MRDEKRTTTVLSWLWALAPVWSLGFGTAAVMGHATVKKRSVLLGLCLPLYVAGLVLVLAFDPDHGRRQEFLFGLGMTINMGLGLAHAVTIRSWVFPHTPGRHSLLDQQAEAMAEHRDTVAAREAARHLLAEQPALAHELKIGRPDLPGRTFPDGGLVDVNRVDERTLAAHAHVPLAAAARIVEVRRQVGEFDSFEDMLVLTDVEPYDVDPARGVLAFGRRAA
ncbi:hypothetical protein ACOACO_08290 [Nocardioides sp. CPCC 205120]|uniref:hypothetical protein n=1 Tax=Nocardioides sp. CPCC 205120 TaxID=3406462 RepID=UPI003B5071DB